METATIQTIAITEKRYTIEEVASELSMSTKTLRRLIHKDAIKAYKIGKRYYFTRQQIETYLASTETNYSKGADSDTK